MRLNEQIAFIGGGKMAEAILKRMIAGELVEPAQITVSEPVPERREYLESTYGIRTADRNRDAIQGANIVILAIRPQVLDRVLLDLHDRLAPEVLVISIVAGARISTLRDGLNHARIVRSMPNTPAQVGKGMTVWTATTAVTEENREHAQLILEAMGQAMFFHEEHYLDMATGLSGSGPGFIFLFIEALIDAGVHIGFTRQEATQLVLQTVEGSVELLRQTGAHPAELRNRVTSPAGTTAAGTLPLERSGLRGTIIQAIEAAYLRSKELGDLSEQGLGRL